MVLTTTRRVLEVTLARENDVPPLLLGPVDILPYELHPLLHFVGDERLHGSLPAAQLQVHLQAPQEGAHGHKPRKLGSSSIGTLAVKVEDFKTVLSMVLAAILPIFLGLPEPSFLTGSWSSRR
jgi:hypothetical protein